jgi:YD repeat-containing protein
MPRILLYLLSLILLFTASLPAADKVDFGTLRMASVSITGLAAEGDSLETITLRATLDHPVVLTREENPYMIQWKIIGEDHGYAVESGDEPDTVVLAIGDPDAEVTVQACLALGDWQGGCKTITIKTEELTACLTDAMFNAIPDQEWDDYLCLGQVNDALRYVFYKVNSRVNTVTGDYTREKTDLSVTVPGGRIEVVRRYEKGRWTWDHLQDHIKTVIGEEGTIAAVKKAGVVYRRDEQKADRFNHGSYEIVKTDEGYTWEDKRGNWKRYDDKGRILAFGGRHRVVGRYRWEQDRLAGIADRDGRQVVWFEYDDKDRLKKVKDNHSRAVIYNWFKGNLSQMRGIQHERTFFRYDDQKRLIGVTEPSGKIVQIEWYANGRVRSVLDDKGHGHRFAWDYDKKRGLYYARTASTSGLTREIWYEKEGEAREVRVNGKPVMKTQRDGDVLRVTDERGLVTVKTFDDRENLVQVDYPDGTQVSYGYEKRFNRLVRRTDERGIVTTYGYDDKGNRIRMTEAVGTREQRETRYEYDSRGNLVTTLAGDIVISRATHNDQDQVISRTDAEGNETRYAWDAEGNLKTLILPDGSPYKYRYNEMGRRIGVTDPEGLVTKTGYDRDGNRVWQKDAAGRTTRFYYDPKSRLVQVKDAAGNRVRFVWDADGNMTQRMDEEGRVRNFGYDVMGRMVKSWDGPEEADVTHLSYESPEGCPSCGGSRNQPLVIRFPTFERRFAYDERGRKITETDRAEGYEDLVTQFEYDKAGNLTARIDRNGNVTRYAYDALNRLVAVTDAIGGITRYQYDRFDNLIALTDAENHTTRFAYDRNNRLVKEIRPMGEETLYGYGPTGRLTEKVDAKGQMSQYFYDRTGRLMRTLYFASIRDRKPQKVVTFAYDQAGNLIGYNDGTTSGMYRYDVLGRKIEEITDYGTFTKTNRYSHHKNGKLASFTGPDGITYTYAYDDRNRLKTIDLPGAGRYTVDAYRWNRPSAFTFPGGMHRTQEYDPFMRLSRITVKKPDHGILMDYRYEFDNMNNILLKDTEHGPYRYDYDALYRLTGADNPTLPDERYTYDGVGNRLTAAETRTPWRYNANNELLGFDDTRFAYDDNGSTIAMREGECPHPVSATTWKTGWIG